jgi:hypothetical protein
MTSLPCALSFSTLTAAYREGTLGPVEVVESLFSNPAIRGSGPAWSRPAKRWIGPNFRPTG